MSEQESGGDRGAGRTARSRRDAQQGARCAGQWGAVRRAGGAGRQRARGGRGAWPSGPRPTWRLQLGRVRAERFLLSLPLAESRGRSKESLTPTRSARAPAAQPSSGPNKPCENSPTKARSGLELPVSASLLRTLSLVFLSKRPIEFWGLWFCSIKNAPWKTGKFLARNQPIRSL